MSELVGTAPESDLVIKVWTAKAQVAQDAY